MKPPPPQAILRQDLKDVPVGVFHCPCCGGRMRVRLDTIAKLPTVVRYRCHHRRRAAMLVMAK